MQREKATVYLDVVGVLVIVRCVEDDLSVGLGGDISGRDGVGHADNKCEE